MVVSLRPKSGKGTGKLGPMMQYSRTQGLPKSGGTCPGASAACISWCYVNRITTQYPNSKRRYALNAVSEIPQDVPYKGKYRIHVSGDFDTVGYIRGWVEMIKSRPAVQFAAYTRSWNVKRLRADLEILRELPNMQLFASGDESMPVPPEHWRHATDVPTPGKRFIPCPEQTGRVKNCNECGICYNAGEVSIEWQIKTV